jgi:hypothetical protein
MDSELIQIPEMVIALAAAIVAYWQNRQKNKAEGGTRQAVPGSPFTPIVSFPRGYT